MNEAIEEYLPDELTEGKQDNAKAKPFYLQRDEEIRALVDKKITHGACRLFLLLCKLSWFREAGGLHLGKLGVLKISVRELAKHLGCNKKSFYRTKKKPGWIDLLEEGNYIWITKWKVSNAEDINVYHVTSLCPRQVQTAFQFASRFLGGGEENGNGNFLGQNGHTHSELAKTGTASARNGELGVGANGNSQWVKTVTGSGLKRALPVPVSTHRVVRKTVTASARSNHRPVGANGNGQLVKTVQLKKISDGTEIRDLKGEAPKVVARSIMDLKDTLAAIDSTVKRLKSDPSNYEIKLSAESAGSVAWLRDPKNAKDDATKKKHFEKADRIERDKKNYLRAGLTEPTARALAGLIEQKKSVEKQIAAAGGSR